MSQYLPERWPALLDADIEVWSAQAVTGELWSALEHACQYLGGVQRNTALAMCSDVIEFGTSSTTQNFWLQAGPYARQYWVRVVMRADTTASNPVGVSVNLATTYDTTGQSQALKLPTGDAPQVVEFIVDVAAGGSAAPSAVKATLTCITTAESAIIASMMVRELPQINEVTP